MIPLETCREGVLLPVHAQPRGRKNAVLGIQAGRLKVSVTEAPEKGKANDALIRVLAEALGLKPAQVALAGGAASRHKKFLVTGIAAADLEQRIAACLGGADKTKESGG
jgi:uncharacterized protein (TIGR00251 family)